MRKKQLNIIVVYLAILFSLALFRCNTTKNESNDKTFEHAIDEKIEAISNPKDLKTAASSNPNDYIMMVSP